jgi:hypothetical protein
MNEEDNETNEPFADDWTMRAPPTVKIEPAQTKDDGWKMPEPIFRVSEGTPFSKSKIETPPSSQPNLIAEHEKTSKEEKLPVGVEIQPQPFISEEFNINQIKVEKPVESKSRIPGFIFGIAGITIMALFAVAFLIGVYFLFFYKSQE